jgi:endonuclease/exonuclease/phosphatase family metal-dependent hydrolase
MKAMVKLLTLNLNYDNAGYGTWTERKHLLLQILIDCAPDIVAFQAVKSELSGEKGMNQIEQVAKALPVYAYHTFFPVQPGAVEGLGFLSRVRITQADYRELSFIPGLDDPNHRILLSAAFDFDDFRLAVFNAHLSWVHEQTAANIPEVLEFIGDSRGYRVLAGDFNTSPDSDLLPAFKQAGWVDAWEQVNPGEAGYTYETRNPTLRIDYVWASRELAGKIRTMELIASKQGQGSEGLSNHLGLLAGFDLD